MELFLASRTAEIVLLKALPTLCCLSVAIPINIIIGTAHNHRNISHYYYYLLLLLLLLAAMTYNQVQSFQTMTMRIIMRTLKLLDIEQSTAKVLRAGHS